VIVAVGISQTDLLGSHVVDRRNREVQAMENASPNSFEISVPNAVHSTLVTDKWLCRTLSTKIS
jgi:hypothetical protein